MLKIEQRDFTVRDICSKLALKYNRPIEEIHKIVEFRFSKLRQLLDEEKKIQVISFPHLFKLIYNSKRKELVEKKTKENLLKQIEEATFMGGFTLEDIEKEKQDDKTDSIGE